MGSHAPQLPIQQLTLLISNTVAQLVERTTQQGWRIPDINESYTQESEVFREDKVCAEAAATIAAAALQLAALVSPPHQSAFSIVSAHFKSAAMGVAVECNVPEILREGGEKGVHVNDIAAKCNVNSGKLARCIRMLANHHIFREVSPNVFANTRISGTLDTRKSVEELLANPGKKHTGTSGFAAMSEFQCGTMLKSSPYILENMQDPVTRDAESDGFTTPFRRGNRTNLTFFKWLGSPGREDVLRQFGIAMRGLASMQSEGTLLDAYDWGALPQDSRVVDVGGGVGSVARIIAKAHPQLRFVVQDTAGVVEEGTSAWREDFPEALDSGQVKFQAHDFFQPQPVNDASMFILKNILHNWSDPESVIILKQLRKAASANTRLMVVGTIIGYACRDSGKGVNSHYDEAPEPLLPNYGAANDIGYATDLTMMCLFNTKECTIGDLGALLGRAGWRIETAHRNHPPNNFFDPVVAAPI